mmetsp:Transcript_27080/g.44473  ORF Transcript_27080/g.44473 Transcript_27080/m.44473 type:complete len:575 (-) Transcript_27080:160-1884(-)
MWRPSCAWALLFALLSGLVASREITTSTWKTAIQNIHRDARKAVRDCKARGYNRQLLPPPQDGYGVNLGWSSTLAKQASAWAETLCPKSGIPYHDPNLKGKGENIAAKNGATMTLDLLKKRVKSFINPELPRYRYGKFGHANCFASSWKNEIKGNCAHYTQVINSDVTTVGCGYADCSRRTLVVCRYNDGNPTWTYPYTKNQQCLGYGQPPTNSAPGTCLQISGMPSSAKSKNQNENTFLPLSNLNGKWLKQEGNSFTKQGSLSCPYNACSLFKNSDGEWRVSWHYGTYGWCQKANVFGCDGNNWKYETVVSGKTKTLSAPAGVTFTDCGALEITDFPCFAGHAKSLRFHADASDSGVEFERVDVAGCLNDAPQWESASNHVNDSEILELTAGNATRGEKRWRICDTNNEDLGPRYVCDEADLYQCGQGKWHLVVKTDATGEDADYDYDYDDDDLDFNASYAWDWDSNSSSVDNGTVAEVVAVDISYVLMTEAQMVPLEFDTRADSTSTAGVKVLVAVAAIVVLAVLVVGVVGYFMLKRRRAKAIMKEMEVVADDEIEVDEAAGAMENATMMTN